MKLYIKILKVVLVIVENEIYCEIAFGRMSMDLTDESSLVQKQAITYANALWHH